MAINSILRIVNAHMMLKYIALITGDTEYFCAGVSVLFLGHTSGNLAKLSKILILNIALGSVLSTKSVRKTDFFIL